MKAIASNITPSTCDSAAGKDTSADSSVFFPNSPICSIDARVVGMVTPVISSETPVHKEFTSSTKSKFVEKSKKTLKNNSKEDCAYGKPPLASASRVVSKKDVDQSVVLQGKNHSSERSSTLIH